MVARTASAGDEFFEIFRLDEKSEILAQKILNICFSVTAVSCLSIHQRPQCRETRRHVDIAPRISDVSDGAADVLRGWSVCAGVSIQAVAVPDHRRRGKHRPRCAHARAGSLG